MIVITHKEIEHNDSTIDSVRRPEPDDYPIKCRISEFGFGGETMSNRDFSYYREQD